jgi:hypothetical protein
MEYISFGKVLYEMDPYIFITLAEDIDGENTPRHFMDYLARRLNVPTSKA